MRPIRLSRRLVVEVIAAAFCFIVLLIVTALPAASADLDFFRALQGGRSEAKKYPGYEHVILPRDERPTVFYVSKTPTLTIKMADIDSVELRRELHTSDLDDIAARAFGKPLKERKEGDPGIREFYYMVAFSLKQAAGKKLETFAEKHQKQRFAVKFNTHLLNVVKVEGPLGSTGFAVELLSKDRRKLEGVFGPIGGKVTWKED